MIGWTLAVVLFFVFILIIGICFVRIDEHYLCNGVIRPEDEISIFSPEDALIKSVQVHENVFVDKGQVLFALDDWDLQKQKNSLEAQQSELVAQLALQEKHVARVSKTALPNWLQFSEIDSRRSKNAVDYRKRVLDMYAKLVGTGAISRLEYEKAKLDLENAEADVERADEKKQVVDDKFVESSVVEAKAEISVTQTKIENLKRQIALLNQEFERRVIRADCPGTVTVVLHRTPGEKIAKGEELGRMMSSKHLKLELYGGARNVHLVQAGQRVQFTTDSFSAWTEGYCFAKVKFIDPDSTLAYKAETNAGSNQVARYYLEASVNDDTQAPLKLGSTVRAEVLLRSVSIFKVLFNLD